ncbi:MAG: colicin V production protein [Cytophagaceae bacterium]|nr:colicin V production protein [Cytophagaceae bacterium]|tara:strand:- start:5950 stop:6492 length:543 start_codon:yes stop_codon:yes gene_type:complete
MNYIDIILAILLLWGLIRGLKNGFFIELASLIALIAGIYGAIHFSYYAVDYLSEKVDWSIATINLLAFAITFIIIVVVVTLAGKLLTKIADLAMLGMLNKLLGALFGILKTGFILSVILMFINAMSSSLSFLDEETKQESTLYPYVEALAPLVLPNILKEVDEYRQEENDEEPLYEEQSL